MAQDLEQALDNSRQRLKSRNMVERSTDLSFDFGWKFMILTTQSPGLMHVDRTTYCTIYLTFPHLLSNLKSVQSRSIWYCKDQLRKVSLLSTLLAVLFSRYWNYYSRIHTVTTAELRVTIHCHARLYMLLDGFTDSVERQVPNVRTKMGT